MTLGLCWEDGSSPAMLGVFGRLFSSNNIAGSAALAEMYALLNTIVVKDLNDVEEDLRRKIY